MRCRHQTGSRSWWTKTGSWHTISHSNCCWWTIHQRQCFARILMQWGLWLMTDQHISCDQSCHCNQNGSLWQSSQVISFFVLTIVWTKWLPLCPWWMLCGFHKFHGQGTEISQKLCPSAFHFHTTFWKLTASLKIMVHPLWTCVHASTKISKKLIISVMHLQFTWWNGLNIKSSTASQCTVCLAKLSLLLLAAPHMQWNNLMFNSKTWMSVFPNMWNQFSIILFSLCFITNTLWTFTEFFWLNLFSLSHDMHLTTSFPMLPMHLECLSHACLANTQDDVQSFSSLLQLSSKLMAEPIEGSHSKKSLKLAVSNGIDKAMAISVELLNWLWCSGW